MPSAGVNLTALASMFVNTCWSFRASPRTAGRSFAIEVCIFMRASVVNMRNDVYAGDENIRDVELMTVERVFAALHLRNIENVVDDRKKMTRRITDERCVFDDFSGPADAALDAG